MALNFKKFFEGIRIIPKTASTVSVQGEMDITSGTGKLNYHNGTTSSPVVTEAHSATLTNKTLTTPTIGDFTNATHNHANAAGGGQITLTTGVTGVLPLANGGTNKNMTAVNGGLVYTDADSMEVTSAGTSQSWVLSGGAGAPTMSNTTTTGKMVDGSADEIQLRVQAHSTQTNVLVSLEDSSANKLLDFMGSTSNLGLTRATNPAAVNLQRANTSLTSPSIVSSGDILGAYRTYGYDGAAYGIATEVRGYVDATPGSGSMPGKLSFWTTATGAVTPTERATIDSVGQLSMIATTDSTSGSTGSIATPGGLGVTKKIFCGDTVTATNGIKPSTASTAMSIYLEDDTASTFTFNGAGGTSASVALHSTRVGRMVTITIPTASATTGTSSTTFTANTAVPASFRPSVAQGGHINVKQGGTGLTTMGAWSMSTGGILTISKDSSSAAFTNATATTGVDGPATITYTIY